VTGEKKLSQVKISIFSGGKKIMNSENEAFCIRKNNKRTNPKL
jgi:hypothetical protein